MSSTSLPIDVVLRDGSTVRLRPVGPRDQAGLEVFLEGLSQDSRLLRFFSGAVDLERAAYAAAHPDIDGGYAVVATTGSDDRIIAHGCYVPDSPQTDSAEIALAIADEYQGRGLGTLILEHLAETANSRAVSLFTGHVLPQNHQMLKVIRDSGFPVSRKIAPNDIEIAFPTALTPEGREQFERREQLAAIAALRHVLTPSSVAVIGASRRRGTPGGEMFHNLLTSGFAGPVYPINAHADVVQSVPAYPSIRDVPGPVDVAVLALPAESVVAAARDCATARVRALIVISAGFAEIGEEGVARQHDLVTVCRQRPGRHCRRAGQGHLRAYHPTDNARRKRHAPLPCDLSVIGRIPGCTQVDVSAVEDILLRVSSLAEHQPTNRPSPRSTATPSSPKPTVP